MTRYNQYKYGHFIMEHTQIFVSVGFSLIEA